MKKVQITFTMIFFLSLCGCSSGSPIASATPLKIDCNESLSNRPASQLSYQGVYAGITLENEVNELLGLPLSTSAGDTYKTLTYQNAYIDIDDKTMIVHDVFVYGEIPSISWFLDNYGCPDVVIHFELHPETGESSNYVSFAYFKAGLVITNYRAGQLGIPVLALGDSPTSVLYTKPFSSLEEYLSTYEYDLSSDVVKIINLEDAIN